MGLAELTVTLSTTVRVHACAGASARVHRYTLMTVVQALLYGSELGVWAPARLALCQRCQMRRW